MDLNKSAVVLTLFASPDDRSTGTRRGNLVDALNLVDAFAVQISRGAYCTRQTYNLHGTQT